MTLLACFLAVSLICKLLVSVVVVVSSLLLLDVLVAGAGTGATLFATNVRSFSRSLG